MVQVKTKVRNVENSKTFAKKLVNNQYVVRNDECLRTKLIFSSEWNYPTLHRINNYHFKMNYLINQMDVEMKKLKIKISPSKVREDALKKDVVIYQKMVFDYNSGRLVDYFFILDTRSFKLMVYKRLTDFSIEQSRVYRAIRYLHDELFMDYEEIYLTLVKNKFDINLESVSHIVSELS